MPLIEVAIRGTAIPRNDKVSANHLKVAASTGTRGGHPEDRAYWRYRILQTGNQFVLCSVLHTWRSENGKSTRLYQMIGNAMHVGAHGAVVGRNVWHHENPALMVKALMKTVYENADIDNLTRRT